MINISSSCGRFKIKTIVRTLEEIGREMVINDQKELYMYVAYTWGRGGGINKVGSASNIDFHFFSSNFEVAVVYYRSCYDPEHHKSEKVNSPLDPPYFLLSLISPSSQDWDTRLALECSRAAVCPTAAYQLAGTKKIQQVLAAPGVLER